ncbi:MAG TPA: SRPBCC domain-containing protein [Devosiaceae bacterium]|jgi:uncharacterized protein YndB with AHSA1/START domain|nr:SRPBCC domain-containing protein [Devosiaceae bacterium]
MTIDSELDLVIERFMRAEPAAVWKAWTTPHLLERWWVPAPSQCQVQSLEVWPGGAFRTLLSEDGERYLPHIDGCFLLLEAHRRLVFTDTLTGGFRPAVNPFMTADISFTAVAGGTEYRAVVKHKDRAERDRHVELGFHDGWETVTAQLAALVERQGA